MRQTSAPPPGSELDRLRRDAEATRARALRNPGTPVHGTPIQAIESRAQRAADNSEAAAAGITAVRAEMLAADARIEKRLDAQDRKHDEHAQAIAGIRDDHGEKLAAIDAKTANMDGKLDAIMIALPAALQRGTAKLDAQIEVEKAVGLDAVAAKQDGRKYKYGVLAWVIGPLVTAVAALLLAVAKGWI